MVNEIIIIFTLLNYEELKLKKYKNEYFLINTYIIDIHMPT